MRTVITIIYVWLMPISLVLADCLIVFGLGERTYDSLLIGIIVFAHIAVLLIMYHVIDRNRTQKRVDREYYEQLRV
jgi:hypothetical protein